MKKIKKAIVILLAAIAALSLSSCSTEYSCELCNQVFTSGGSVSETNDGEVFAVCSDCMTELELYLID